MDPLLVSGQPGKGHSVGGESWGFLGESEKSGLRDWTSWPQENCNSARSLPTYLRVDGRLGSLGPRGGAVGLVGLDAASLSRRTEDACARSSSRGAEY